MVRRGTHPTSPQPRKGRPIKAHGPSRGISLHPPPGARGGAKEAAERGVLSFAPLGLMRTPSDRSHGSRRGLRSFAAPRLARPRGAPGAADGSRGNQTQGASRDAPSGSAAPRMVRRGTHPTSLKPPEGASDQSPRPKPWDYPHPPDGAPGGAKEAGECAFAAPVLDWIHPGCR